MLKGGCVEIHVMVGVLQCCFLVHWVLLLGKGDAFGIVFDHFLQPGLSLVNLLLVVV